MSIREYSMTRDSTRQLSPSFRVREFACKGSDAVLIDDELVVLLQCIREHFGKPVHITSGYRTAEHNAAVGGSKSSQHLLGRAADFYVEVCRWRLSPPTLRPCFPGVAASDGIRRTQSTPPARPAGYILILGRARAGGPCKGVKKMKDTICTAIGIIGGVIASLFGGWDTALQTLVIFMAIDYITGLVVAGVFHASPKTKTGALESKAGWKGLIRKGETLLIVLVACQLDAVIGGSFVRDAAIIGFSANEAISIVENAGLMGLPIPAAITKAIDILKQRAETPEKGKD